MAAYPSLEDLHVDQLAHAQVQMAGAQAFPQPGMPMIGLYAGLGLEELMSDYGGFDISTVALQKYMSRDLALQVTSGKNADGQSYEPLLAVTPANDVHGARAEIKQGVRQVILAKEPAGKFGLAVQAADKGVFVAFVYKESPAAKAGVRLGDQILMINGVSVAGWSSDKAFKALKQAGDSVSLAVRDRPFCRTLTVQKDQHNQVGFVLLKGEITALVKDSSAARNGMLINHTLMEINGQNVAGLKDDDTIKILQAVPRSVTLTIMPTCIFEHLIKSIGSKRLKECMDRAIPEL